MKPEGNAPEKAFLSTDALIPADFPPGVDRRAFMKTAKEMNAQYNETSEAGLAVSVTLC